jgi:hypothetical protein
LLFTKSSIILKRSTDLNTALNLVKTCREAGLVCRLQAVSESSESGSDKPAGGEETIPCPKCLQETPPVGLCRRCGVDIEEYLHIGGVDMGTYRRQVAEALAQPSPENSAGDEDRERIVRRVRFGRYVARHRKRIFLTAVVILVAAAGIARIAYRRAQVEEAGEALPPDILIAEREYHDQYMHARGCTVRRDTGMSVTAVKNVTGDSRFALFPGRGKRLMTLHNKYYCTSGKMFEIESDYLAVTDPPQFLPKSRQGTLGFWPLKFAYRRKALEDFSRLQHRITPLEGVTYLQGVYGFLTYAGFKEGNAPAAYGWRTDRDHFRVEITGTERMEVLCLNTIFYNGVIDRTFGNANEFARDCKRMCLEQVRCDIQAYLNDGWEIESQSDNISQELAEQYRNHLCDCKLARYRLKR